MLGMNVYAGKMDGWIDIRVGWFLLMWRIGDRRFGGGRVRGGVCIFREKIRMQDKLEQCLVVVGFCILLFVCVCVCVCLFVHLSLLVVFVT